MTTAVATLDDIERMAAHVVRSQLFGYKTIEQAAALMLVCQAKGMHPMEAVEEFHIIQGRPTMKSERMLAKFQASGGRVQWHQLDDKIADATFSHPAGGSQRLQWTIEMAKVAGLAGKDNWRAYPRQMLRSRLVAEGVRTIYPGVGGLTPEEAVDLPAEVAERDVTPPKPATGVAALQAKIAEMTKRETPDEITVAAVDAPSPEDGDLLQPAYSYAQIAEAFNRATDGDGYNEAVDLSVKWAATLPKDSPMIVEMRQIAKAARKRIDRAAESNPA